jgi:hypothetical protein
MVQLSATRYSCIASLRVSLVSFAAITLCVTSQRVFLLLLLLFISLSTQSGNFWIHPRIFAFVHFHSQPEDAPCHGDRDPYNMVFNYHTA